MAPFCNDIEQMERLQEPVPSICNLTRNRACNESFRAAVDRSYVRSKESIAAGNRRKMARLSGLVDFCLQFVQL
jgi:hypothetical protein